MSEIPHGEILIFGNVLKTLTDSLKDQNLRVVLNERNFSWKNIDAGVPEGEVSYEIRNS